MRTIAVLLASTSLFAAPAFAAEDVAPVANAAAAEAASSELEIVVLGQGQTRQVQELSNKDITILASGTSPLKAIEKLPSVNFQSADAFGNYEWSTRITIRGFNQNQLGFNLDGIPLGDMSYGNANGLHVSRAIISENVGLTRVSQGSGSINAQSTNNLGGTLEFFSLDPKDALGADASGSYGSDNTWRGFARIGLGTVDGARAFVSAQYQDGDKWKGDGKQRTFMVNAKGIVPLGGAELDGYISYSNRAEQDYQDLTLEQLNRLGYDWDNFGPSNYALAIQVADIAANRGDTGTTPLNAAAGTTYPAPITTADDAYYDASGLRKDTLGALGLTVPFADTAVFKIKGYYHENDGQGTWGSPYVNSPSGVPMALRTTEYDIKRKGVFASIANTYGMHNLTVGGWYEKNDFIQSRKFYGYESRTNPGRDHLKFQTNPFATQWSITFETDTIQYYVTDDIDLGDLKVNLGWKGYSVDTSSFALVNTNNRAVGDLKTKDWFQPHAGLNYKLGGGLEAFAGFTQVTRSFLASTTGNSPFSASQDGFDAIKDTIKPESSDTYEAGLRYNSGVINASLAGYYVNFRDRLLVIPTSVGIVGATNALQNVGSVRALGIEAAVDVKLPGGFGAFASYSYNDTTYRDDVTITAGGVTTVSATAGKTVVDTPKHLLHGELSYDGEMVFGRLGVNYMSKRYFTYLNDLSVPSRAIVDATIGYRLDIGQRQPVELQLNAVNLFDKRYVSTIGSNGFGFSGDNQTLLAAAPRQVFVTLKAGF